MKEKGFHLGKLRNKGGQQSFFFVHIIQHLNVVIAGGVVCWDNHVMGHKEFVRTIAHCLHFCDSEQMASWFQCPYKSCQAPNLHVVVNSSILLYASCNSYVRNTILTFATWSSVFAFLSVATIILLQNWAERILFQCATNGFVSATMFTPLCYNWASQSQYGMGNLSCDHMLEMVALTVASFV